MERARTPGRISRLPIFEEIGRFDGNMAQLWQDTAARIDYRRLNPLPRPVISQLQDDGGIQWHYMGDGRPQSPPLTGDIYVNGNNNEAFLYTGVAGMRAFEDSMQLMTRAYMESGSEAIQVQKLPEPKPVSILKQMKLL
jgi:hypothetical protein